MSILNVPKAEYLLDESCHNDLEIFHVRLTDSALRNLEYLTAQPQATFKLSLNGKQGSFVIPTPGRDQKSSYTLTVSNTGNGDGFHDCLQINNGSTTSLGKYKARMTINAKDDSFFMAKERMAQQEYESKKSATKQLSVPKTSQAKISSKPRNMSQNDGGLKYSKHSVDLDAPIETSTANQLVAARSLKDRIMHIIALKPITKNDLMNKLSRDGLTREQKEKIYKVMKEVSVSSSNDTFSISPEVISHVDPDWPGYSKVERLQVVNMKNKHKSGVLEKNTCDKKQSLSKKINVLDEVRLKPDQKQRIAFQNGISMDTLNQWCLKEIEIRERYNSCNNNSDNKSDPNFLGSQGNYSSPKKARISMRASEVKPEKDSGSLRISTAPRLPGSRSKSNSAAQNNPFLADLGMEQNQNNVPLNSTSVSKSNHEPALTQLPNDFTARRQNGSGSSSGCSSMSSVIPSPVENESKSSTYSHQMHFNANQNRLAHRTNSRNQYGQNFIGSGGESSEHTPCSGSSLVSGFSNRSGDSPNSVSMNRTNNQSNRGNGHTSQIHHATNETHKTFRAEDQTDKKHSFTAAHGRWNSARGSEADIQSISNYKAGGSNQNSTRRSDSSKRQFKASNMLEDNLDGGDTSSVDMDISEDENDSTRQQAFPSQSQVNVKTNAACEEFSEQIEKHRTSRTSDQLDSLPSSSESKIAFQKSTVKNLYSNGADGKPMSVKSDKLLRNNLNKCEKVLDNMQDDFASEVAELDQIYPALANASAARNYRLEFDSVYPVYLQTHSKSTKRWNHIRHLYDKLHSMNSTSSSSDDLVKMSGELQMLIDEAMSSSCQVEELQLSVMDYKLKLLKSRLADFYGPRIKNCDKYSKKVSLKRSHVDRLGAALS